MYWHEMDSPIGPLLLAGTAEALTRVHFQAGPHPLRPAREWRRDPGPFAHALAQLQEYFAGARRGFDLTFAPRGTRFQLAVWQALVAIPYGHSPTGSWRGASNQEAGPARLVWRTAPTHCRSSCRVTGLSVRTARSPASAEGWPSSGHCCRSRVRHASRTCLPRVHPGTPHRRVTRD